MHNNIELLILIQHHLYSTIYTVILMWLNVLYDLSTLLAATQCWAIWNSYSIHTSLDVQFYMSKCIQIGLVTHESFNYVEPFLPFFITLEDYGVSEML